MKEIDLYKDFWGEAEYTFKAVDKNNEIQYIIDVWDGYFMNLFDKPIWVGDDWIGFTKLYLECIIDNVDEYKVLDKNEFLKDLLNYKSRELDSNAKLFYDSLVELATLSIDNDYDIIISYF